MRNGHHPNNMVMMDESEGSGNSQSQESDFRLEENLRIKIGEAKNLHPRNSSSGFRDVYCTVNLDREEIFRTCVVEKTLLPFFGEEFKLEIPRRFRHLSFYLFDKKDDIVLGKVAVRREHLSEFSGKDHWMRIQPVDEDSEVEGKIHVSIKMDHVISSVTGAKSEKLAVQVIECSELGLVNGSCHSFVSVALVSSAAVASKSQSKDTSKVGKRTKTRRRTTSPLFHETFHLNFPKDGNSGGESTLSDWKVRLTVFHESNAVTLAGNVFLGQVLIPLSPIDLEKGYKCWHMLSGRNNATSEGKEEIMNRADQPNLGSLRIRVQYTSDYVLATRYYDPLRSFLLKSSETKPICSSSVFLLGELVTSKIDAAQPLVKIFYSSNQLIPIVKELGEWEISRVRDANTIFRGNTLLSKFLDELMKLIGGCYLHGTLRHVIHKIIQEKKCCEIDPCRIKDPKSLDKNMSNLRVYLEQVVKSITSSAILCPIPLRQVFAVLKDMSFRYFPRQREISYSIISGFIFLRFFAPAILNPKLFDLTHETVCPTVARTLTLISKTVMMMGNVVSSKVSGENLNNGGHIFKEHFMNHLQQLFLNDNQIDRVRLFLELISTPNYIPCMNDRPLILREGHLMKRLTRSRNQFGIMTRYKKFKKRYFTLTTQGLQYSRNRWKPFEWILPAQEILAVEKLHNDSFHMKNMFQILFGDGALYIKANNCVEEKEWTDVLNKICQRKKNRLHNHPSAFIDNHWLCCNQPCHTATGCQPVSPDMTTDIGIHIDPNREVARIHSLFLDKMCVINDLLKKYSSESDEVLPRNEAMETRSGNECDNLISSTAASLSSSESKASAEIKGIHVEDAKSFCSTLSIIKRLVLQLEDEQKIFMKKVCEETVYGSEEAPIGDNNYLTMLARRISSSLPDYKQEAETAII